ncbi:MAG: ABC transporter ATP-binding protein [Candidatus Promineifilaceae bacterium]|jgi:ABC-2 type transport system ATP-binding protein
MMDQSDLAISASHLRKEFGKKTAVKDFTLDVSQGEVFGFLGPNGAGKTTAVKMMMGLIHPTSGSASMLGSPIGDRVARTRIGFLPEHFRFHEWLQAAEFLDLHGRLYGMSPAARKERIPELLDLVGLARSADTRLSSFSKGMLQRIGLAQALINSPELVFLDEPTSGLDPLGRRLVRDIIRDLRNRGITVFLNSHFLSEIELTCDRVSFIRQGEILRVASLEELANETLLVDLRIGNPDQETISGLEMFGSDIRYDESEDLIHISLTDEEQIPEIVSWLIGQGQKVYELSPQRLSLEERFLQIVGDEMLDA